MKTIFRVWVLLGFYIPFAVSQNNYGSEHVSQDAYHDPQEGEHQPINSYEYESHANAHSGEPARHQNRESKHHQPKAYSTQYFRQFYDGPHHEPQTSGRQPEYYGTPEHVPYNQPEDPSYHRPQEIGHHQPTDPSYHRPQEIGHHQPTDPSYHRPQEIGHHQPTDPSYHRPQEIGQHQPTEHYQDETPRHNEPHHVLPHYHQPEPAKDDDSRYKADEPNYSQTPSHSPSSHRGLVPTDPKLPLYFTMYEKRTIQDPHNKYGKGPWRYLTYGHGISYGTKGPGKVFEKGYGYIRALGRDHCKLPEHLCPPKDEKPFEYEGRKEPYFGYRPH